MIASERDDRTGWVVGGRYRLLRRLASGGMATVYEGTHVVTLKRVAVKVLHPGLLVEEQARERFFREAQAPASIGHPGIVDVSDAGVDEDGSLFLVMELLEGESFGAMLARASTTRREAVAVIRELLEPLGAAHARGFVHRDLKPDNVFVAQDARGGRRVLLLDFGIARASASHLTRTGAFMGTFGYASPEQARNPQEATAASDVWAVGVMLYRAIAGRLPFGGSGVDAVMHAANEAHVPLDQVDPKIPSRLARLVDRCLFKQPADRPADALTLARELEAALADTGASDALDATVPRSQSARETARATPDVSTVMPRDREGHEDTATAMVIAPEIIEGGDAGPTVALTERVEPTAELPTRRAPPPTRSRAGLAIALAGIAILIAGAIAWAVTDEPEPTAPAISAEPEPAAPAPEERAEEPAPTVATPEVDPTDEEPAPPGEEALGDAPEIDEPIRTKRRSRRRAPRAPEPEENDVRYGPNMAPILR